MTSVKDFEVDSEPTHDELGRGRFVFSDRYSVFDWGTMPDRIPDKGAVLCLMGAHHFERLEEEGIPTHYRGVRGDESVSPVGSLREPPRAMEIDLTRVPDLPFADGGYDYAAYHESAGENYLVPLEVIFRNRVPLGSSLRRRSSPRDHGLDEDTWPEAPVHLRDPVVEFSTKYEEQDRYLDREEAAEVAGKADLEAIESLAHRVNERINRLAEDAGFVHEDGKIECFYYRGELRVADVVGTFDENRFSFQGQPISKEVLRQYYRSTQPDWVEDCKRAKQRAHREGIEDWKSLCDTSPDPLPDRVLTLARHLYAAGANRYLKRDWFEAPDLKTVLRRIRDL